MWMDFPVPGALLWEWEHPMSAFQHDTNSRGSQYLWSFLGGDKALNVQAVDPGKEVYMPLKYRYLITSFKSLHFLLIHKILPG